MNPIRSILRPTALRSGFRTTVARPVVRPVARTGVYVGPSRTYATRESALRDRSLAGPFSWKAALVFVITGAGLYVYFEREKEQLALKKRQEAANQKVGRPSIGGPFSLLDTNGNEFTDKDLKGHWTLLYFGFTNCPDICPEELDKMGEAVELIDKDQGRPSVLPVFFSVDPARDDVPQVKRYLTEFHPRMVGLTGDYDSIKRACKSYRVYFSTPPDAKPTDDYLVDHSPRLSIPFDPSHLSIFFYLMDPLGQFVDAFGKATSAEEVAQKTTDAMAKWEKAGGHAAAGIPKPKLE